MNRLILLALAVGVLAGCGGQEPARPGTSGKPAIEAPPPPPPPPAPKAPETVLKKADVGMGARGQGYGVGPVATPIATRFRVEQRLVLQNIQHALDLFKAAEGRAVKSHEEFMEEIIKANNINLPPLPAGQRYLYDPKEEQLMVEQPAPQ
jgi:hypothetical protein